MGRVGSALDNAMMESFFGTLQRELLDRKRWATRAELASAIFEWIEAWYNPRRRHTSLGNLSPVAYEHPPAKAVGAAVGWAGHGATRLNSTTHTHGFACQSPPVEFHNR